MATAQTSATNSDLSDCWAEQYSYDPWGNLTSIAPSSSSSYTGCTQESGFSMSATTKNQLQDINNDFVYDAAGNLTKPGPTSSTYTFDAENHLVSAGGMAYLYDGDGKRVGKAPSSTPTQPNYLYWYGTGSQILEETDGAGNYQYLDMYFNGKLLKRYEPDNWVDTFFQDALGNTRCVYGDGDPDGGCSDYYPFGGERPITYDNDGVNVPFKFTGKERDSESGLDNFGARYNSSSLGRFMSPDPANFGAVDEYPQTWNAYSYVANNPLNAIDPNGLDCVYLNNSGSGVESIDHSSSNGECQQNGGYWANGNVPNSSWVQINQNNDTATIYSQFSNGGIGVSVASQTWTQGAFGLGESFPTFSNDDLNPFARGVFSQINKMPIEKFVGVVYGGSVVLGLTGGAACYYLCPEAATISLAGETGTDLIESTNTLNKIIGGPQRELLKEFFETGKAPEGLSQRTLQIYKQIAQRAISAGKDQLGVQAQRIQMISNALK